MMELFFHPGEGMPIHSVCEDFLLLHGSKCDASTAQIVLVGVINLELPINLLDGLRWAQFLSLFLVHLFGRFLPSIFP